MTDINQVLQCSRHLLSKSLQYNIGRKSRVKARKDHSWRILTDVDEHAFGLNHILYQSPHQKLQRNQILCIEAKKYPDSNQIARLQADSNFLKLCKAGLYNFSKFLLAHAQEQKDVEEKLPPGNPIKLGKNIVNLSQQKKVRVLYKQMPKLVLSEGVLRIRGDFQCGNLQRYIKIQKDVYIIILKNDTNTQGYTQWFNFYIQSNLKVQRVKFIIVNIKKPIKYVEGMKLLTRSHQSQTGNDEEWSRNLDFVQFQTNIQNDEMKKYSAIAFSISSMDLQHGMFVSLSYPYSISRLKFLCKQMISIGSELKLIQIGKTSLGNKIIVFKLENYPKQRKRSIIILARQHASQTASSFICEFLIKRLSLFNSYDHLAKQFNWHIIPIANPDGVILGNARTNLKGYDMNRCWAPYLLNCSPEAQCINYYIQGLDRNLEDIFIDLHTHSRDLGFFTYAHCQNYFVKSINSKMKEICPYFEPQKCKVGYDAKKRNTFRLQMQNQFKIKNALTIETSFYGYICKQTGRIKQFYLYDYQQMAICILKCLQSFIENELTSENTNQPQKYFSQNLSNSESDSDPQGDYLDEEDRIQAESSVQTQVLKKINFAPLNEKSISNKVIINRKRNLFKEKKSEVGENHPNIVNLYHGVNNSTQNGKKSKRIMSACMNELAIGDIQKNYIFSQRSKQLLDQKKFKVERRSLQNPLCHPNYLERKSFKNLFVCAQQRSQVIFKEERRQEMNKSQSKSDNNSKKKAQTKAPSKKVTNLIFPTSHQVDNQLIKELGQKLQRKNLIKGGKGLFFDRKSKLNNIEKQTNKTNSKIAMLCEYVRKLEKTQIFV